MLSLSSVVACRGHYPGGTAKCLRRSLPSQQRPSRNLESVGFRIFHFEAYSAFTHVSACHFAESPKATLYTGDSGGFVASTTPPIATGWNDPCRTGLPPARQQTPFQGVPKLSNIESTGPDSNRRHRITGAESWPLDDQCVSVGPEGLEPSPTRLRAGNAAANTLILYFMLARWELNPRPASYKDAALTAELRASVE